jgi:4-amino-4-deoxychorismate lyase
VEDPLRADLTPELGIIETFAACAGGFPRLARHLARMQATAARLGYRFDRGEVDRLLASLPPGDLRVRLLLEPAGLSISHGALTPNPALWRLAYAADRLAAGDPWLQVKTTRRALYDRARAALPSGVDELVFLNTRGEICEGTITNIFVQAEGVLLTPPLASGLLPGCLRAELLETGAAREAVLRPDDLAGLPLFVGNSLRGLIPATF